MTGNRSRLRDGFRRARLLLSVLTIAAALMTSALVNAGPAIAAYPRTGYSAGDNYSGAVYGNFIWYNRSVQVGGTLYAPLLTEYGTAVVYSAYSSSGKMVARAARPGDGVYLYGGSLGHGFTLDASSVVGGIRHIDVTIWVRNPTTGQTWQWGTITYARP
jgi:hypothetical protein